MTPSRLSRALKDPLTHFVLLGALLFVAYGWMNRGAEDSTVEASLPIRLSANDVQWMQDTWGLQWGRAPTEEELRQLVADFLEEQALAREAQRMGLDNDDLIVRRRMAQKLRFMVEDVVRVAEPTEDELRRTYDADPTLYTRPPRASFTQVLFKADGRADPAADARSALAALAGSRAAADGEGLGDATLLNRELTDAPEPEIAALFGPGFAAEVVALEPGSWHGPLESPYGVHLVWVESTTPGARLSLEDARAQVAERARDQRSREAYRRFVADILARLGVEADESVRSLVPPAAGGR